MRWTSTMWAAALFAVAMLASLSEVAMAQYGKSALEITPSFGYRWGGSLSSISGVRDFDTEDNISYGVGIGRTMPGNSSVEISWMHFAGDVTATLNNGFDISGGPLNRDDIMLKGTWYAYRPGLSTAPRPFITSGLGCSIFGSEHSETVGRFSWNLGAGVRKDINERFGLRFTGLWMPTWVTTGTGLWCDPFYPFFCYSMGTGEYYDQFEVSGGLIIKL